MSALERFVQARRFRARAAEYFELAADEIGLDVRARYLAIADHYTALADHELRSDRLERKKRLEEMSAARDKRAGRDRSAERERGAERDWGAAAARAQSVDPRSIDPRSINSRSIDLPSPDPRSIDPTSSRVPPPVKLRVIQGQIQGQLGDTRKLPPSPPPLSGSLQARLARRKYSRHGW
jgi:hypothetical protein